MSSLMWSVLDLFKFINDFEQKEKKLEKKWKACQLKVMFLRLKFGESCETHAQSGDDHDI